MSSLSGNDSARLRKLLQFVLVAPVDLDSFCLDYFPDVYHRFGTSPDRDHKLNLLLMLHAPEEIERCLYEFDAARVVQFKSGRAAGREQPRPAIGVQPMWIRLAFGGSLLLPVVLWMLLPLGPGTANPGGPEVTMISARKVEAVPPTQQEPLRARDTISIVPTALPIANELKRPRNPKPQQLSNKEIERVLGKVRFAGCAIPESSEVMFDLTIEPDGHVSSVSTPELGQDYGCIRARVKEAAFPEFSGKPMTRESYPVRVYKSQTRIR